MKNSFLGEIAGLVAAGIVALVMWVLDLGNNTLFQISNLNFSVRLVVALIVGVIISFAVSAVLKRRRSAN